MRPSRSQTGGATGSDRDHSVDTQSVDLLGLSFSGYRDVATAARQLLARHRPSDRAMIVHTCNVDHAVRMDRDPDFRAAYDAADVVVMDGWPIVWLARGAGFSAGRVGSRITGSDLVPSLVDELSAAPGKRIAIVGGSPQSAAEATRVLAARYPGPDIRSISSPERLRVGDSEDVQVGCALRRFDPHLVIVCLGSPLQELWMRHHVLDAPRGLMIGAGATVDFLSGRQRRAPVWMQRTGVEWTYRLATQWRRLSRRYLDDLTRFPVLAVREIWVNRARGGGRRSDSADR